MSEQQIQKVKVKRLAHIGLWSADVAVQARFYRHVLGFDLLSAEPSTHQGGQSDDLNVFLTLGEEHQCLSLFHDNRDAHPAPRRSSGPRSRLHHLSFELNSDAELAALAARLQQTGVELRLEPRDGDSDLGDTLWFSDPDGNRIEIFVVPDDSLAHSRVAATGKQSSLRPTGLQHIALRTNRLEEMVEFYVEELGFDISDWLLRDCAWLRCNNDHHTLVLMQGQPEIDHIGYAITDRTDFFAWADHLSHQQVPILWGPGRHGAGNDLFMQFADVDGHHLEFSSEIQQYYDQMVTSPPRLWHSRLMAFNLWGSLPAWIHDDKHY